MYAAPDLGEKTIQAVLKRDVMAELSGKQS
jgi:hypothetical protein